MEGSPGLVKKKKKKLSHIQIRCNLLDFHSLLSFLLSFQTIIIFNASIKKRQISTLLEERTGKPLVCFLH